MTQPTDTYTFLRRFWLRSLLGHLSCIGVLSLLSNNLVLAQTKIPDAVVVPTKIESKSPSVVKAPAVKFAPNIPHVPAPARRERLRAILNSPAPVRGELRQQAPTLPVRRGTKVEVASPATPRVSPKVRVTQPPRNLLSIPAKPTRNSKKAANNSTPNYNGAYIDPTEYRIGATSYQAPSSVVLSERSTGCKAVLRQGQGVLGSICGTPRQRTRVAMRGTQLLNSRRSPRSQAPSWVSRGISSIRVAPIISSNGRVNKRISQTHIAASVPTRSAFYYNLTPRPTGMLGVDSGLMFPLTVPAPITSLFGWRIHPITGSRRFHSGTDFGAALGTPVLAADAGKVAIADFLGGYGLAVVLDHKKFTQQTLYGHLSEIFVQPGEWVEQGAVIGRVGSTGNSTGPHLHFETRTLTAEGWVATDPGVQLKDALAQLVESLRVAQLSHKPGT